MVMRSTLSPQGTLAVQTDLLWVNILVSTVIAVAAVAALDSLKKS